MRLGVGVGGRRRCAVRPCCEPPWLPCVTPQQGALAVQRPWLPCVGAPVWRRPGVAAPLPPHGCCGATGGQPRRQYVRFLVVLMQQARAQLCRGSNSWQPTPAPPCRARVGVGRLSCAAVLGSELQVWAACCFVAALLLAAGGAVVWLVTGIPGTGPGCPPARWWRELRHSRCFTQLAWCGGRVGVLAPLFVRRFPFHCA